MDKTENQISNLEHKETENSNSEQQEEKRIQKNQDSVRNFWDSFKYTTIHVTGVPEGEGDQEIENLFQKIMTEKYPNLKMATDTHVQEAQSPKQDEHQEAHTKTRNN